MSTPRLCTGPRVDEKRDNARIARRRAHAAAFEAATERITRHVSAEIGKPGMRLLEEIADGAKRGPGEILEQIVDVARDHKAEAEAIAPLRVLAQRLGYGLVREVDVAQDCAGVVTDSADAMAKSCAAIGAIVEAARDGRITAAEVAAAEPLIDDAIAMHRRLRHELQNAAARECPPTLRVEGGRP